MKPLWNRFHYKPWTTAAAATRKTAVLSISLMRVRQVSVSVRQRTSDWKQGSFSAIWIHFLSLYLQGLTRGWFTMGGGRIIEIHYNQSGFLWIETTGAHAIITGISSWGRRNFKTCIWSHHEADLIDSWTKFAWKLKLSLTFEKCVKSKSAMAYLY